ncbi:MAG: peptide chain release factor N(5)-glutamine methyltransferase [Rickettsiales bacterium]|nr:peptide chain release factor N(5)-glutamine methyltransferase [Rickettsiales bacterium]
MKTLHNTLRDAEQKLRQAGIDTARLDARLLLQHTLKIDHNQLLLRRDTPLSDDEYSQFEGFLSRRISREPLAQIIGTRDFWKDSFIVSRDVLTPRPDSETLLELIIEHHKNTDKALNIIDFGCGSGCLGLSLLREFPNATLTSSDISETALEIAERNAERLKLSKSVIFLKDNWGSTLQTPFDMVICNPPYIAASDIESLEPEVKDFEPLGALSSGSSGLEAYEAVIPTIKRVLALDGIAVLELGMGQCKQVSEIASASQLRVVDTKDDLSGVTRAIMLTHK